MIRDLQRLVLRHSKMRWLFAHIIPPRITARIIGIAGVNYTEAGNDREDVVRQYYSSVHGILGQNAEMNKDLDQNTYRKRILVDITSLGGKDQRTGVQRVVRSILQMMPKYAPTDYCVVCVFRYEGSYHYADLRGDIISVKKDDIFLGLDLDLGIDKNSIAWLNTQSNLGLKTYFVVYDILPLLYPRWFPAYTHYVFKSWLLNISSVADGLICISKTMSDQVREYLSKYFLTSSKTVKFNYFHLGANIENSIPSRGISSIQRNVLDSIGSDISILMVGTIEPRKGYAQALDAFEILWTLHHDVNLIIVGKEGWSVKGVIRRIRKHPELGKHLFWFDNASDDLLLELYDKCSALLMASEGEGFGLPLVEAAVHGKPIILRDIPVFREIIGNHGFYFSGIKPIELSTAIDTWIQQYKTSGGQQSKNATFLTWEQSTQQLIKLLI